MSALFFSFTSLDTLTIGAQLLNCVHQKRRLKANYKRLHIEDSEK
jgi:hypothetical protein